MRLAVFTSNQPRHLALLDALVDAGHEVHAAIEPKTRLAEETSPVMAKYWARVHNAETAIFGGRFCCSVPAFVLQAGELSRIPTLPSVLRHADRYVVFSSSYIRPPMIDWLIAAGALNLHVGIAPEYRGSAPNAWAQYDGRPDLIGAQVQLLSKGLDAGLILTEVRPPLDAGDYFTRSMRAVQLGIEAVVRQVSAPTGHAVKANDATQQLRYSRHADFTDDVAAKILAGSA